MTKQEEIREGRLKILEEWGIDERVEILNDLERYDNSQGVVIKVDIGGGYSDIEPLIKE